MFQHMGHPSLYTKTSHCSLLGAEILLTVLAFHHKVLTFMVYWGLTASGTKTGVSKIWSADKFVWPSAILLNTTFY
jgi:hypothetical protein